MTENIKTQICIIGAGSAGLSVAAGAAQLGMDVTLIEKGAMGGDCLNTGCVPSKALLAAAKQAAALEKAGTYGIHTHGGEVDYKAVQTHVQKAIRTIAPHDSQQRFEALGVRVIREEAAFTAPDTVKTRGCLVTAKYFVIAAGSSPALPPVDGLDPARTLTNETIFTLTEKPGHLMIIGGGPIGMEMAQAHRRIGCEVSLFEAGSILSRDDRDAADIIRQQLIKEGVSINENVQIEKITYEEGGVLVHTGKAPVKGTHLLVAAGRRPNTDGLNLEAAGVAYDKNGIQTDRRLRSSQKHIFAAGDIAGGPQFTHAAGYHAGIIIRNMLFKLPAKTDYSALPWVTYTAPELAQAGMTEAQAREKYGRNIKVLRSDFRDNDRAITEAEEQGFLKVIAKANGQVIGTSIVGAHAGELIGFWTLMVGHKMKIGAAANMIAPYPTLGEISKRAAGEFYKDRLFSDKTRKIVRLLQKLPF